MSELLGSTLPWTRDVLIVGFDVAVKATVIIAASLIVHVLLGSRRPLIRSVLWNSCLLGLLALPIAVAALPRLAVAWLPRTSGRPPLTVPGVERAVKAPVAVAAKTVREPTEVSRAIVAIPNAPRSATVTEPASRRLSRSLFRGLDRGAIIVLVYSGLALLLLVRLAGSILAIGRLRRSSLAVLEGPWIDAFHRWKTQLGVRQQVTLAQTDSVSVPVVVGCRRPAILVPTKLVASATPSVIDAVVLHELAHIRRGDFAWNVVLRLVQAVYWPHPLNWAIGAIVSQVREGICDEVCVFWTGDARAYRMALVEVARGLVRGPREALGMAMTRSSKLVRRLSQLATTQGLAQCLPRIRARLAIAAFLIAIAGLLGCLRLVRPTAALARAPKDTEEIIESTKKPAPSKRAQKREFKKSRPDAGATEGADAFKGKPSKGPAVQKVTAITARRGRFPTEVSLPVTLQPLRSKAVHAKSSGIVMGRHLASVGDRVKEGDVLAEIEDSTEVENAKADYRKVVGKARDAERAIDVAKYKLIRGEQALASAQKMVEDANNVLADARKEEAERQADRVRKNPAKNDEAKSDQGPGVQRAMAELSSRKRRLEQAEEALNTIQTELENAEADYAAYSQPIKERAAVQVSKAEVTLTPIRSPIAGVILQRNITEYVSPNRPMPLFVVGQTDTLIAPVLVPEQDALLVDVGDPVTIVLAATADEPIRGKVSHVAAQVVGRELAVEIEIPNANRRLRPGLNGTATIVLAPPREVLSLPSSATLTVPDRDSLQRIRFYCYKVVNGRARRQLVRVGPRLYGDRYEILSGLNEGDQVITYFVNDGGLTRITEFTVPSLPDDQPVEIVEVPTPDLPSGDGFSSGAMPGFRGSQGAGGMM